MAARQEPVQHRSSAFFDAVQAALDNRLAERRIDPDQQLRVTVIGLADEDIVAIGAAAEQHGVTGWVRTERADPAPLTPEVADGRHVIAPPIDITITN